MLTAHASENTATQFLHCPYLQCDRDLKTFVRKDKWLIHIAIAHEGTECPMNHCKAGKGLEIKTREELMKHIRGEHGSKKPESVLLMR